MKKERIAWFWNLCASSSGHIDPAGQASVWSRSCHRSGYEGDRGEEDGADFLQATSVISAEALLKWWVLKSIS